MKYWKITIEVEKNYLEDLLAALTALGEDSLEIEDPADLSDVLERRFGYEYDAVDDSLLALEEKRERGEALPHPRVILYVEDRERTEDRERMEDWERTEEQEERFRLDGIERAVFDIPTASFQKEALEDSLWTERYKEQFGITELSPHLLVVPPWEEARYLSEREEKWSAHRPLYLEPGMAFGTGDHPTTSMCARMMERCACEGKRVLDVGTGSGILAMGAALLGAEEVLGIDIDPMAVEVAAGNVARNRLEERVTIREGDLLTGVSRPADLVLANLFAEIIMALAPAVKERLSEGGYFVSTGILSEKRPLVEEALQKAGFRLLDSLEEEGWVCLLAQGA